MAPLLFVLDTQPLMRILDRCCSSGELTSIQFSNQASLLYQLFVDNACLFLQNSQVEFDKARKAVQLFENISGAHLNVQKLVIVPLSNPQPQDWHIGTGCRVLKEDETTMYLGCLIGFHVMPLQQTEFILGKVRKRLSHWVNHTLSFVGKTVLLNHVLCATLVYQFMSMGLNLNGY